MESTEGVDLHYTGGEESISIKQQSGGCATHHSSVEIAHDGINPPHYSEKNYLLQNQPPLVGNIPFPEEARQEMQIIAERLSSANSSTSRKKRALFASGSNASSGGRGR